MGHAAQITLRVKSPGAIYPIVMFGHITDRKRLAAQMDTTKPIRIEVEPIYGLTPFWQTL